MADIPQRDFAIMLGVTPRQVARYRDLGMPYRTDGNRILILMPAGINWLVERRAATMPQAQPTSLDEARQRYEAARAEMAELELGVRRGELVAVKDHVRMLSEAMERMASKLHNLPYKVATQVTGKTMDARQAQARRLVDEVSKELCAAEDVPAEVA